MPLGGNRARQRRNGEPLRPARRRHGQNGAALLSGDNVVTRNETEHGHGAAASLPPFPSSSSPLPPQLTDDGQEMTSETCLLDRRSRPLRDANERAALWRERVVHTTIS